MTITNCLSDQVIEAILTETIAADSLQEIEQHLSVCSECVVKLEQASLSLVDGKLYDQLVGNSNPRAANPTALRSASETEHAPASIRKGPLVGHSLPAIPGYKISEWVGRGGMGDVYRATQTNLNREVALKTITGGLMAGPERIARFYREAESLAKVDHENVVKIFDVGEWDGTPYIAMEWLDGESLEKSLDGAPWEIRVAAQLVLIASGAVHAIHQSGVTHRDIKPGNLLARAGSLANDPVHLKIVDFGLAKTDGEQDLTQTGQTFGTPTYMAPEQATGRTKDICAATDVYALGCILYELLTGRPPLQAATFGDTVRQIAEIDPIDPSKLNPAVAKDLSVICVKCLQKQSERRYASASELADDLQRYLDGSPIRARPISAFESAWKLAKRRPVAATAIAVSMLAVVGLLTMWGLFTQQLASARSTAESNAKRAVKNAKTAAENEVKANAAAKRAEQEAIIATQNSKDALIMFDGTREILRLLMENLTDANRRYEEERTFDIEQVLDIELDDLDKQLQQEPFSAGRLYKFLGFTFYKNGFNQKAIDHLLQADAWLDFDSKAAMAERFDLQYTLALAFAKRKDFEKAIALLDKLLAPNWNPKYPEWEVPDAVVRQLQSKRDEFLKSKIDFEAEKDQQ